MESSKGDAVFDSLNLNPQLFINETINTVDDIVDEAFDFYRREASTLLKIEGSDRSEDLSHGIDHVHGMIQSILDKRLQMWEHYCLRHCFSVPDGFTMPESDGSANHEQSSQDASYNLELDAQLDSLREKLSLVGKKSAELNSELQVLERTSGSSDISARLVNEALQLYDQPSVDAMFKEMARTALELGTQMDKLKTKRMERIERVKAERIKNPRKGFSAATYGLDAKLKDLEDFLAELRRM
ncbi:PREDICTED: protein MIS12 homolog [Tarenaya hassleriana]|uniref:protein MIS12 homolog n=1 Tax=Tarenaya hassleriana TaxID=28532 RepID=UPI00053C2C97|nr:PREDICTED: protein MIS12 homolog [Tarenaya hassleriana]XP_010547728.1 PREDICTED: protein MIS12 homolog [Tarenaya hassleriana]XP_010547729.1 PREDICTED: protein MIS12 homolog [Tarenaya hassleriana]